MFVDMKNPKETPGSTVGRRDAATVLPICATAVTASQPANSGYKRHKQSFIQAQNHHVTIARDEFDNHVVVNKIHRATLRANIPNSSLSLGLSDLSKILQVTTMNLMVEPSVEKTAAYLRTLPAIRERCERVYELAKQGKLEYFDYHPDKEAEVAIFCSGIIKRDFQDVALIPPHSRWRHLDAGHARIEPLIASWKNSQNSPSTKEVCKRLIDLFLVSVLLDAGAGNTWKYHEKHSGLDFSRSEGLAVASYDMFVNGFFSGDSTQPFQVDARGLASISAQTTTIALQVNEANPMVGVEGRTSLLSNLSEALKASPAFFGSEARPGNLIDFLTTESRPTESGSRVVPISALWHALIYGFSSIWPPARTSLGGVSLGDVWPCDALKATTVSEGDELVPFHKLTGWITYSLLEPMQKILGWEFEGLELLTGLPEYRNGGLLLDFGVLSIKQGSIPLTLYPDPKSRIPRLPPSHPAIVEWRAMTVIGLDRVADAIRKHLGLKPAELTLAQILESATWKGGREIAKQKRPDTGGPPIDIESDGTVF